MAFIVDDILLFPVTMVRWLGEKLQESAEKEITDESKLREELLELQMRLEMDEITEAEYEKKEAQIMEKLEAIRKYKEGKQISKEGDYGRSA